MFEEKQKKKKSLLCIDSCPPDFLLMDNLFVYKDWIFHYRCCLMISDEPMTR